MSIPDFLLDKRVVDRNVAKGLVKTQQVAKHLSSLPDVESNSEPCLLEDPPQDEAEAGAEEAAAEADGAEAADAAESGSSEAEG